MPDRRTEPASEAYALGKDLPLPQYLGFILVYVALAALVALLLILDVGRVPDEPPWADLALVALATHKLTRIVAHDWVTSPLRAPFTRHVENAGAGEFLDKARGSGWRAAVGDLLTCPYCLGPWIGGALVAGLLFAPAGTRVVAAVFAVVAVSDFLHEWFELLRSRNRAVAERA